MINERAKNASIISAGAIIVVLGYLLFMLVVDQMDLLNELATAKRELEIEKNYSIGMQMQFGDELRNLQNHYQVLVQRVENECSGSNTL